jgi:tRNA threonylcarbamoyladenosine biosynthesis protein TsaB
VTDPTYILCIETASTVTSVAIAANGKCIGIKEVLEANQSADKIHILIEALLSDLSLTFTQLHAVAISAGPGSYTGLRIAASAAKGYCFSLDIPLIAVPTFETMVQGAQERYNLIGYDAYVPMIDARRMEVFTSFYNANRELTKPLVSIVLEESNREWLEQDKKYVLFGNGAHKAKNFWSGAHITIFEEFIPSAADLCILAAQRFEKNNFEEIAWFEPGYAKEFHSTKIKE